MRLNRSEVWQLLCDEVAERCSVSTTRDLDTVTRRFEHEGASFFNLTLPAFGKDFERSLEEGAIPSSLFAGWVRGHSLVTVTPPTGGAYTITFKRSGLPLFLQEVMGVVFDTHWEVTEEEYLEACAIAQASSLSDGNLFPPVIRIPKDAVEEERMAEAIHCIRQLTLLFSKEWALPGENLVQRACEAYVTTDKELERPFTTGG